jgi:pimeloyl-ACP methyl ester carboxylesterase
MPSAQPPSTKSQKVTLPSSRVLGYATYGAPPSPTVPTLLYFHGFPTSRLEASFITTRLTSPIHVVAPDRPGIGLSTFQPGRRILDWPADVLFLVNHLTIEKFHIFADSGGSPYALACKKELPKERVLSTTIISGIYPLSLGTEGMLFGVKAFLYGGYWLPQSIVIRLLDWEFGNAARSTDKSEFERTFMKGMEGKPERDRKCLDDLPFREMLVESMREAFLGGSEGAAWDCRLYGEWGFGLEEVDGEGVTVCHGRGDVNAPLGMAEKAAKLMKGCRLRVWEEETHLSLPYNHAEEIIKEVLGL